MSELIRGDARKVQEILSEIERRKNSKRDYVFSAPAMMVAGGKLALPVQTFQVGDTDYLNWQEAESAADKIGGSIVPHLSAPLPLTRTATRQLCEFADVPCRWIDGLREKNGEHGKIADDVLTRLLGLSKGKRLVRCLDGQVRACLSDSYRILENYDLFFAACESFQQANARIWSARLTDDNFELVAVSDTVHGEVIHSDAFQDGKSHGWSGGGDGGFARADQQAAKPVDGGDVHRALVKITNSETGNGGLGVFFGLFRDACNNTLVSTRQLAQIHVGKRLTADADGVVYSDETRESEGRTFWLKVRDCVRTAFDPERFGQLIAKMNGLAVESVEPEKAVEAVAATYKISDDRKAGILKSLFESNDYTRFGVIQAVTAQAHAADAAGESDWASECERIGGELAAV